MCAVVCASLFSRIQTRVTLSSIETECGQRGGCLCTSAEYHADYLIKPLYALAFLSFSFARGKYLAEGLLDFGLIGLIWIVFLSEKCSCFTLSYTVVHNKEADVVGRVWDVHLRALILIFFLSFPRKLSLVGCFPSRSYRLGLCMQYILNLRLSDKKLNYIIHPRKAEGRPGHPLNIIVCICRSL